jgi:hypothetical protein
LPHKSNCARNIPRPILPFYHIFPKSKTAGVEGAVIDGEGVAAALAADGTRTVFAVNTGDLLFEGGTRSFTLEEGERSIPVTVEVSPNLTGAAVFLVERVGDREFLTRKDTGTATVGWREFSPQEQVSPKPPPPTTDHAPFSGSAAMMDALGWVDYITEGNQEWLIRVEAAEILIPRTILGSGLNDGQDNIIIRLRGTKDIMEHIIKHDGTNANLVINSFNGKNYASDNRYSITNYRAAGLINILGKESNTGETAADLTLQLEKGITLEGAMTQMAGVSVQLGSSTKIYHYQCLVGLSVMV